MFDYAGYRNALPYASDETQDNSTDVDANAEPALSNDLPADPGVDVEKFAEVKQA